MEQIDQLKSMRDAAKERLEAAIKALEQSPDAKLVNSLTALIDDLEESLGLKETPKAAARKKASDDPVTDSGAAKAVEGADIEPPEALESPEESTPAAKADEKDAEPMSLEDSLEAELLGSDLGKS